MSKMINFTNTLIAKNAKLINTFTTMNNLQRITALFLFVITSVFAAHAAGEWMTMGEQDGVKYSIYTKITSDGYSNNHVVWILVDFKTQPARAEARRHFALKRTPFSERVCVKFNSAFSQMAIVSAVFYDSKGTVIYSFTAPYDDFIPIVPDTLSEVWAEWAQRLLSIYGK